MKKLACFFLFSLCLGLVTLPGFAHEASIHIHNAWVREAPPNAKMLAAYLIIENHSKNNVTLNTVTSPMFDKVEIHRTEIHDGMAHMVPQPNLPVGMEQKVVFEPNGLHIMLIGPKKSLHSGDQVELSFSFSDGTKVTSQAPVKKVLGSMGSMNMDSMEHDHHQQPMSDHDHGAVKHEHEHNH